MKETGTTHWNSPNMAATNESGFTALPGGWLYYEYGSFNHMGFVGWFWTATEVGSLTASYRGLNFSDSDVSGNSAPKGNGFAIRCVKDSIRHLIPKIGDTNGDTACFTIP